VVTLAPPAAGVLATRAVLVAPAELAALVELPALEEPLVAVLAGDELLDSVVVVVITADCVLVEPPQPLSIPTQPPSGPNTVATRQTRTIRLTRMRRPAYKEDRARLADVSQFRIRPERIAARLSRRRSAHLGIQLASALSSPRHSAHLGVQLTSAFSSPRRTARVVL
jgi:hypothetical protein